MITNPYQQYKEQSLNTLTKGQILIKLYDEAVKQIGKGINGIGSKNYDEANTALLKAQDIISALKVSLDDKFTISQDLNALYDFIYEYLIDANLNKDVSKLNAVLPIVCELRDAFKQAERMTKL